MVVRFAFSVPLRISWVLYVPKNSCPSLPAPSPQPEQNATPVGAIVGVYQRLGMIGLGPSWCVFAWAEGDVSAVVVEGRSGMEQHPHREAVSRPGLDPHDLVLCRGDGSGHIGVYRRVRRVLGRDREAE